MLVSYDGGVNGKLRHKLLSGFELRVQPQAYLCLTHRLLYVSHPAQDPGELQSPGNLIVLPCQCLAIAFQSALVISPPKIDTAKMCIH